MSEHTTPEGMKAWAGGEYAPDDWDGGPVLRRHGGMSIPDGPYAWSSNGGGLGNIVAYTSKRDLPAPHPMGFYSPPGCFYAGEVAAFEKAHPFTSHEKARKADGSPEDWGRVRYHHSHVDATFDGWVKGRYSLTPVSAAPARLLERREG
jgi:hypothetical protein